MIQLCVEFLWLLSEKYSQQQSTWIKAGCINLTCLDALLAMWVRVGALGLPCFIRAFAGARPHAHVHSTFKPIQNLISRAPIVGYGVVDPPLMFNRPVPLTEITPPIRRMSRLQRAIEAHDACHARKEAAYSRMRSVLDKTYKEHLPVSEGGRVQPRDADACSIQ